MARGDNGNVFAIVNNKDTSRNQTFTYDALNRLASAQNAGTDCNATPKPLNPNQTKFWGNTYGYDAWGNLLAKTVTKCSAENLSVTALANNQLLGYGYDAAGNMTSDPTDGVTAATYDAENRIATATKNGASTTYIYDADGNRVEKTNGSTATLYWYMSLGIVAESDLQSNLQSEYVFFDGERVARKDFPGGAVSYYFSDRLKTTDMVTDAQGNIKNESDFYAWGGELQFLNGDSNHYKFTGKERDAETGLDNFGARYYSNGLGKFGIPDFSEMDPFPVPSADFDNPQSLNLYSYVHNSPLVSVDADGHDCVVQTRTGPKTENVSVSSGNCDNVKVGDGQTKTYVPGTVNHDENGNLSIRTGQDSKSIDIGYRPYEGGGSGVQNANAAPIPGNINLAPGWGNNADGYRTLTQAGMTVDRIAILTAVVAGTGAAAIAGTELLTATAAARSSVIFRLAHGMRVAGGHGLVLAGQAAVRNAIAAAIASGAFQKMGPNAFEGVVYVQGLFIRFTGGWNAAGQMVVSNVMRVLPK